MSIDGLLEKQTHKYLIEHSLRESPVLHALGCATLQLPQAQMMTAPEESQFIALLLTLMRAEKVIEIGVFTGYTTLAMAQALPEHGSIIACDISKDSIAVGVPYWEKAGVAEKIKVHIAPALTTLNALIEKGLSNTFDFIFIDADKAAYQDYLECSLQLIKQGGLIAIDNTLGTTSHHPYDMKDQSNTARTLREFNSALYQDERVCMSLLPIAQGLTLVMKK